MQLRKGDNGHFKIASNQKNAKKISYRYTQWKNVILELPWLKNTTNSETAEERQQSSFWNSNNKATNEDSQLLSIWNPLESNKMPKNHHKLSKANKGHFRISSIPKKIQKN